jgi:trk system potassium uptake protein TrkH
MNVRSVLHVIAHLLGYVGILMAICSGVSFLYGEARCAWLSLLVPAAGICFLAGLMWAFTRNKQELSRRDGLGVVAFGWLAVGLIGALPYYFSGVLPSFSGAFFESFSGITTTGASVISILETVPKGLLLWRSLTQFMGGMGVLIFVVAVLPFAGAGGLQLFRAEMTGPAKERLEPRVASTAKWLWGVYLGLTFLLVFLLRLGGMGWFDSICHSLTTMATGGFSTRTASIAAFNSVYIEMLMAVFMLLSSISFALHYHFLRGEFSIWAKDRETRFFLGMFVLVVAVGTILVGRAQLAVGTDWATSLRNVVFTSASIVSTSGFTTADYDHWPVFVKGLLIILMLMGGCAGSTAGGIKVGRIQVLLKAVRREIRLFMQPQAAIPVRMGRKFLGDNILLSIVAFVALYLLVMLFGVLVMLPMTPDAQTAVSAVITCMGNVGPGFSAVGPTSNFAGLSAFAQIFLGLLMLVGRLELYTILALFVPMFWRK